MKKRILILFAIIYLLFSIQNSIFAAESTTEEKAPKEEITVVTIVQADKTGNKKNELDGSDMIMLLGNVIVSVKKGSTTTVISADSINYNREKDMLYAEGSVTLNQTSDNSGEETATAESLLFNTSTLEGIFDGGRIVQTQTDSINLPSGSTLVVASDIFGRDDSGTITFKNGALTFCDENPPHWQIKASRIWLLPGDEFAFFNAVLYVGKLPVLYLPAFWYPKDELIFNPVFGFRQREGYYFQTTTYLFGRKPLSAYDVDDKYSSDDDSSDADDSYFSFVKPSKLKEQERQGLMLHNLKDDYKGDTTNYTKLLADWYSSLGYMLGIEGVLKPDNDYISNLEFSAKFGFSQTVFSNDEAYSPYGYTTGATYDDSSNFLGIKLPYRYSTNLTLSIKKPLTLSLSMPLYSDPYFSDDFGDRMETMDWIDYLISNPNTSSEDEDEDTSSEISSFSWNLSGSYSIPLPELVKPYISTLSISSFSSAVLFSSLTNSVISSSTNADNWKTYTPERKFYYPSQINPIKITGKIEGTIISLGGNSSSKSSTSASTLEIPLTPPAEFSTPKGVETSTNQTSNGSTENQSTTTETAELASSDSTKTEEKQKEPVLPESALPSIDFSAPTVINISGLSYNLGYSIAPSYVTEFSYSSTGLTEPEDFDWNRMRSTMYTLKVPTTLTSKFGYKDSFFSVTDTFLFNPVFQSHPYLSTDTAHGGYTETNIQSIKETDYAARKLDLTNTNAVAVKPFYYTDHFKETGISWNTTVKMVRTEFVGDADNPKWDYLTTDFSDEDSITVHTLNATLAATQFDNLFGQKLVLSTTLPPQVDEYYGTMTFTFPYTTLTFETGVKQVSSTDSTWEKEPFKQALSLALFNNKFKLTESYTYEREESYSDALRFSLSAFDFQAAYTARYTYGYDFEESNGWVMRSNKEFLPYSFSFAYATSKKTFKYWKNRISWAPTLSTSLVYDYLRPTNSYFIFEPAITLQINEFFNIQFSASSRNDVIYRYMQQYFGTEADIAGEKNWLTDLMNSFRFDDEDKRKSSGFKIESFNIAITHDLHDWDFGASFEIEPRLVTKSDNTQYYDYSPYFTLSVVWRPMAGMKTKIVDEYGDWELNP